MDWQPISTAPKNPEGRTDGPWLLLWSKFDHGVREARWSVIVKPDSLGGSYTTGWVSRDGRDLTSISPSYWQPTPQPPSDEAV